MAVINAFSAFNVIAAGLDEALYIVPIGKTYAIGDLTICPHNYNGPTRYDIYIKKPSDTIKYYIVKGSTIPKTIQVSNLTLTPNDTVHVVAHEGAITARINGYEQITDKVVRAGTLSRVVSQDNVEVVIYTAPETGVAATNCCLYVTRTEFDNVENDYEAEVSLGISRGNSLTDESLIIKAYAIDSINETINLTGLVLSPGERIVVKSTKALCFTVMGLEYII